MKIKEGALVEVVRRGESIAVGVLMRKNPRRRAFNGITVFAFFRPPPPGVAIQAYANSLSLTSSVAIMRVANLDLEWSGWRVPMRLTPWDRRAWPVPAFANQFMMSGGWTLRTYDEDEPVRCTGTRPIDANAASSYPKDGAVDSDYVETSLGQLLNGG